MFPFVHGATTANKDPRLHNYEILTDWFKNLQGSAYSVRFMCKCSRWGKPSSHVSRGILHKGRHFSVLPSMWEEHSRCWTFSRGCQAVALGALRGLAVLPAYLWLRWQEQGTWLEILDCKYLGNSLGTCAAGGVCGCKKMLLSFCGVHRSVRWLGRDCRRPLQWKLWFNEATPWQDLIIKKSGFSEGWRKLHV